MRHEPRAKGGARARASTAADAQSLTRIPREKQREPFRVVLVRGLWRGVDCLVEPPTQSHPMRHFRDHAEALEFATELARVEGWPIHNRTQADG